MEALVSFPQHRNKCYRGKHATRGFKGINCRTFHSEAASGILPSPPLSKAHSFTSWQEPRSPSFHSEPPKLCRKSKPIPINRSPSPKGSAFKDDFACSELWAGPTYSNSPPPSSLPIPKFSLRQKRSASLELPLSKSEDIRKHVSKSAPSSPTRESTSSASDFIFTNVTATENLRRILQLDVSDD